MEGLVAQFPLFPVAFGAFLELGLGAGQHVERRDHVGFPGVVAALDGLLQGRGFEKDAGSGDILEVVQRDRRDTKAALPLGHDEGVGDEQLQGLPQGAGAHGVVVLEVFDAKLLPGRVNPLDDVAAKPSVGRFGQGLGFIRRAAGNVGKSCYVVHRTVSDRYVRRSGV